MRHWIFGYITVCVLLVLSACNPSPTKFIPTPPVFTSTSQLTSSPNVVQEATATTTKEETAIILPTETSTPESVRTLTANEKEQAEAEIKHLFQNSDLCTPPCYLGITPGQTTSTELQDIFAKWGIKLQINTQRAPSFYINQDFKSGYNFNAKFQMQDDIVESIGFNVNQDEPSEWSAYSPKALLERYGTPSKVSFWIGSIHEPNSTPWKGWYYMIISFDEMDLHIEYGDVEVRLDEKVAVCPQTDNYGYGRVWLGKYPDFLPPPHVTPIEEAGAITVQQFHDYILLGPGACFYLDLSKVAFL